MAQEANNAGLKSQLDTDEIFRMVNDPHRRKIIRSLADGGWKTALDVNAGSGRKRHGSLKHLTVLCNAGLLVKKDNPNDLRQPLFALAPEMTISRSAEVLTVGFGLGR